jgi:hypothetical protein
MALVQTDIKYTLTGPDGSICSFNDITDTNYVGQLTDVTGFDSPEVRESADDLVQFDGGIHGDFFYGRRPITLSGVLLNPATTTERNQRTLKLDRATDALRGDALLQFQPDGYPAQRIWVRRQQPLRITGAWQKEFQVALVAADPRVYSDALNSSTVATADPGAATPGRVYSKSYSITYAAATPIGQILVTNAGTTVSYPTLRVYGPGNNPVLYNFTTGQSIRLNYSLSAGDWLTIDTLNRTVLLNDGTSRYGAVDFANTSWWGLNPGVNDIRVAYDAYVSGSSLNVQWRDAWM